MPNKRTSTITRCLKTYIVQIRILNIVQYDNNKEFKEAVLILLKNYISRLLMNDLKLFTHKN